MEEGRKRGREGCKERQKRGKGGRNGRKKGGMRGMEEKHTKKMRIKGRNEDLKKERKVEKKVFQQTTWQLSS